MSPEQAKTNLIRKLNVTNQMVTYAKSYILENFQTRADQLLESLLESVEARKPEKVVIHPSVDSEEQLSRAAKYISWYLAGREAVWGLISNNCLIPDLNSHDSGDINIDWTTVIPGNSGASSGWRFEQYTLPIPRNVYLRPSGIGESDQPLSDPDLYMRELDIEGLNQDIESSLREAVLCFKNELYLGCLALLGRAAEGAWVELGLSLAKTIPDDSQISSEKLKNCIEDQFTGIGKKISEILKSYERKDIFGEIYKKSNYKPSDLRSCVVWGDAVRESRNSIHYGAEPAMSNSYEKVAALLIGTVPNLKVIYSIIKACNEYKA